MKRREKSIKAGAGEASCEDLTPHDLYLFGGLKLSWEGPRCSGTKNLLNGMQEPEAYPPTSSSSPPKSDILVSAPSKGGYLTLDAVAFEDGSGSFWSCKVQGFWSCKV